MFCPKCHKELISGELREFETLSEHVMNPNMEQYPLRPTFICNNPECECSKKDIFWIENGDCYGGFDVDFENDMSSTFPSISRRLDIEVYGKGLKRKIYLPPFLMLWFLRPYIEFKYKADDYGKVLSKSWSLKWLKKEKLFGKGTYHIGYIFPFVMIKFHLSNIQRQLDIIKKHGDSKFRNEVIKDIFKSPADWDKRWWRHFEIWLGKQIYRKTYKKYCKDG